MAGSLSDGLDGALPAVRWVGLRMHLALCPSCRRVFATLRQTVDLLGSLQPTGTPIADPSGSDGLGKQGGSTTSPHSPRATP